MKLSLAVFQNNLTTIFGVLAGLPVLVIASCQSAGVVLIASMTHILGITGAVGLIGLGIVSKAFNVHSTVDQVEASTATVTGVPNAPALVAAADKQVAGGK